MVRSQCHLQNLLNQKSQMAIAGLAKGVALHLKMLQHSPTEEMTEFSQGQFPFKEDGRLFDGIFVRTCFLSGGYNATSGILAER